MQHMLNNFKDAIQYGSFFPDSSFSATDKELVSSKFGTSSSDRLRLLKAYCKATKVSPRRSQDHIP